MSTRRIVVPLLLAASIARVAFGEPQLQSKDPVGAARDLYASARYDEALAVLNDLRPAADSPLVERRSIEQYRSLCLLALGRGSEAESAIAQVITADPLYVPSEAEASPRVRSAFADVRRRLLPDIATSQYAEAKSAFDRKEYPVAAERFRRVMTLLTDPDMGGRLGDLKVLASGFLDLSVAATPPPPPPEPKAPVTPPPAPKAQPDANRIYTVEDSDVVAPTALRQEMPRMPPLVASQAREHGVIEVVIDEQGRVEHIAMRQSVHPIYDNLLVSAAREWHYQPATFMGTTPVKYRKLIQINIARQP